MKMFKSFLPLLLSMTGCVHMASVSLTQIPAERSKPVEAQVSKFVFLGFNFDNSYVDEISYKLQSQCPDGRIEGLLTEFNTTGYVLFFDHVVKAKGFCVRK